jgi:hypothetical protein
MLLREVRVEFDLVDRRCHLTLADEALEVLGAVVADADRAHSTVAEQSLRRLVGGSRRC